MKRTLAVVTLLASAALAQSKDPVTSTIKDILPKQQKNLVAAAESMPAEKYGFKPTPEQISFGAPHHGHGGSKLNNFLCSKMGDTAAPKAAELKETDSKDTLVAALKASFDFCSGAIDKVTDAKLGNVVELRPGRSVPLAFPVIIISNDWADHYSTAAMYLRLNGILPPTVQPKK